jgi:predicted nucleic acid-binding protein
MFVLDASVLVNWCLPEEADIRADAAAALIKTDTATAPFLLWFELHNVLLTREWRKQLSEAQTKSLLRFVRALPIETDRSPDYDATLTLARRHRLTFYDASYLELAQRKMLPLATLDGDLAKAAQAENVVLIGKQ